MAKRWDKSSFDKAVRTPQGFLKVPVYATRTGVFKYTRPDGSIRRELRLPEEVFKKESMDTLSNIPLTFRHPDSMVDENNADLHMKGYTVDAVENVDDKFLKTFAIITNAKFIKDIETKKIQEVSCGYNCDLEETTGTWNGEVYDCIQRNIVYNHLAGVERGRAGAEVRFRLDSQDAIQDGLNEGEKKMEKITLGGKEFEVSAELKSAIEAEMKKLQDQIDSNVGTLDASKAEQEKTAAEKDKLQAKVDSLESDKNKKFDADDVEKKVNERVASRVKVLSVSKNLLPAETKFDEMSDRQLKELVIKMDSPKAELEKQSDVYVDARFDSICETIEEKKSKMAGNKTKESDHNDAALDSDAARKRQNERTLNAWKQTDSK